MHIHIYMLYKSKESKIKELVSLTHHNPQKTIFAACGPGFQYKL